MLSTTYRPEIDGLRAISIASVLLFHVHVPWLRGGFVGVDVFFVISGFLITGIIDRELAQQSFSLRAFYARRIRRILPALLAVVAATLLAQYCIGFRPDCSYVGKQAIATVGSFSNIFFWHKSANYWEATADTSPLLHTWSLAIEEQFYLLLPFGLMLLKNRGRLCRTLIIALTIVGSLGVLWRWQHHSQVAGFYLLPSRWWELAAGGLLAQVIRDRPLSPRYQFWAGCAGMIGLVLVVASTYFLRRLTLSMSVPVAGAALVLAFGHVGPCHWLLTRRPLVHLGKLSYSLYLWHWPLLVFAAPYWESRPTWWLIAPIYGCALLSFHGIEQVTRWRSGIVPHIVLAAGGVGVAGFLLTFADRMYDTSAFIKPIAWGVAFDVSPNQISPSTNWSGYELPPRLGSATAYREEGLVLGNPAKKIQVMVIGDSHGLMWSQTIQRIIERHDLRGSFCSMAGVLLPWNLRPSPQIPAGMITSQQKYEFDRARLDNLARWRPDVVILSTPWDLRTEREVADFIGYCQEHSRRVLLVEQPPRVAGIGDRSAIQYACYRGLTPEVDKKQYLPILSPQDARHGRALLRSLAARFPGCRVVPTADLYESAGRALLIDGLHIVYRDDDHLSDWGAHLAESRLEAFILEGLADSPRASTSEVSEVNEVSPGKVID